MNVFKRIVKNTLSLFAAQFVGSILSILLSIFVARNLGDVIFGKYAFIIAFTALFTVFLDLGYETLLIREVARDKSQASKYLNNIISIRAVLSVVIFALIIVIINVMSYPDDIKNIIYVFTIYSILKSLSNVFKVTFRAFEKMEYEAGISILSNILRVTLGLSVLFLGYGLMELVLVFLFSGIFEFAVIVLVSEKKFIKTKMEFDLNFLKSTIKVALPLGTLTIFGLIYIKTDTIMLSFMKGDAVVGWYNAAYNLILGFRPIPHLFMSALLPLMAYYYISSKESLKIVYEKSFKYLLILGLPITIGIFLLADRFILLVYGQQFINSIIVFKILAWDILLKFLYFCASFILVSADKQNQMAVIVVFTALINVVLNLFLIPYFSYVGAAIATITTETFLLISYVYLNSRHNLKIPIFKITIRPVVACATMGLFIYQFREINLILLIVLSIILYFGILFLIRGFSKEDISLFKKLIKK
jgi:O-antigen/teichoic acid export membrane protein